MLYHVILQKPGGTCRVHQRFKANILLILACGCKEAGEAEGKELSGDHELVLPLERAQRCAGGSGRVLLRSLLRSIPLFESPPSVSPFSCCNIPMASSDISIDFRPELNSYDHLKSMRYISTDRPWLSLYGIRVQPVAPFSSLRSKPDLALIHYYLPDELLFEIFARMSAYSLGRAACVCRKWKYTVRNPTLWRNACLKTWQRTGMEANFRMLQSLYDSSWRKMWVQRPRIRNDGLYVSRNTYIHTGITEWQFKKTVNVVCYYRYLRFFPSGKFLYKISPQKIKDVVKCMHFRASKGDCVFKGDYILSEDGQIEMALLYPGHRYTLVRMRLRLRGTTIGANNRLDVVKILTTGVNSTELRNWKGSILELVESWEEDETHDPDVPAVSHRRGLTPFVFVPFEEADTSVLNLPVEKMDYFFPG